MIWAFHWAHNRFFLSSTYTRYAFARRKAILHPTERSQTRSEILFLKSFEFKIFTANALKKYRCVSYWKLWLCWLSVSSLKVFGRGFGGTLFYKKGSPAKPVYKIMRELHAGVNDAGQRLDKFMGKTFPKMPQSLLYKYLRQKCVKVNGTNTWTLWKIY